METTARPRKKTARQLDFLPEILKSQLAERLESEGEWKLARRLHRCGLEVPLMCGNCGTKKMGYSHCDAKWCPCCQGRVATRNKDRVWPVVSKFRWPLHVTLTSRNTASVDGLRKFRDAFTKFRRSKFWTGAVKGGVCGYEMTHKENGYHPHAHMILDCEWLADKTPQPNWRGHPDHIDLHCMRAHDELSKIWGKYCKQREGAIVWVKRTAIEGAVNETLKYSLKTDDVLAMRGKIGSVIHALNSIRSMTTFGSAYKIGKKKIKAPCTCDNCGMAGAITLESELWNIVQKHEW